MDTKIDIPIDQIIQDDDLQMREGGLDWNHVDDLKHRVEAKDPKLCVVLFCDVHHHEGGRDAPSIDSPKAKFWIGDGNHTIAAHRALKRAYVSAEVRPGGRAAALAFALSANAEQVTKPRTRKDVRRAVEIALENFYVYSLSKFDKLPKDERKTFQEIADLCKTTKQTVSNVAKSLEAEAAKSEPSSEAESSDANSSLPVQQEFYELFNEEFNPVFQRVEQFIGGSRSLIGEHDREDKIDALQKAKAQIVEQFDTQIEALKKQDNTEVSDAQRSD